MIPFDLALLGIASCGPRKRKKSGTSPKRLSKEDRQAQQRKVAAAGAYNTRLSLAFYSICVRVRTTCRKVVVLCLLCLLIGIGSEMKVESESEKKKEKKEKEKKSRQSRTAQ